MNKGKVKYMDEQLMVEKASVRGTERNMEGNKENNTK